MKRFLLVFFFSLSICRADYVNDDLPLDMDDIVQACQDNTSLLAYLFYSVDDIEYILNTMMPLFDVLNINTGSIESDTASIRSTINDIRTQNDMLTNSVVNIEHILVDMLPEIAAQIENVARQVEYVSFQLDYLIAIVNEGFNAQIALLQQQLNVNIEGFDTTTYQLQELLGITGDILEKLYSGLGSISVSGVVDANVNFSELIDYLNSYMPSLLSYALAIRDSNFQIVNIIADIPTTLIHIYESLDLLQRDFNSYHEDFLAYFTFMQDWEHWQFSFATNTFRILKNGQDFRSDTNQVLLLETNVWEGLTYQTNYISSSLNNSNEFSNAADALEDAVDSTEEELEEGKKNLDAAHEFVDQAMADAIEKFDWKVGVFDPVLVLTFKTPEVKVSSITIPSRNFELSNDFSKYTKVKSTSSALFSFIWATVFIGASWKQLTAMLAHLVVQ